jgi:hypothetical protein
VHGDGREPLGASHWARPALDGIIAHRDEDTGEPAITVSRRSLLGLIATAPLGIAAARAQGAAPACYDPAALPAAQANMRKTLGFMDLSPDPAKRCGLCVFFSASKPGCGTCVLLSSGPVGANSVCNSFGRKV